MGFPQYGFKLRHHAVRSGTFRRIAPRLSLIPDLPADRYAFAPAFETRVRLPGSPPLCADLWRCSSHLSPEVLALEGFCCPFLRRLATSSASLETSASFPSLAGYSSGLWHSRTFLPGLHTFRTSTTVLSRIAVLQLPPGVWHVHPHSSAPALAIGEREETLGLSNAPAISSARGPNVDGWFVRSRYGPLGCSPSWADQTEQRLRLPKELANNKFPIHVHSGIAR